MSEETVTTGSVTLKAATDAYLEHLATGDTKPSSILVYRKVLDLAINHFGEDRKLDAILLPQVGRFYASKEVNFLPSGRPKAAPTVKQIKRVFRQCLEYAKSQNWILDLPVPKGELLHARSKQEKPEAEIAPRLRGQDFMPVVKHQK
jgi:hypothetical protein